MVEGFYDLLLKYRKSIEFLDVDLTSTQNDFLESKIPFLGQELLNSRDYLDPLIIETFKATDREEDAKIYPLDACLEITYAVFDYVMDNKKSVLNKIKDEGIVVKKVYGIIGDSAFHNALQVGNYFVNLSYDALEGNSRKIKIDSIDNINFKQIDSYEQMFDIMEKYWGVEIFPNQILPEIAPIFPYVMKNKGQINFDTQHLASLLFSEVKTDFKMAEDFLFNSKYSNKKIDEGDLNNFNSKLELISGKNIIGKNSFENLYQVIKHKRNFSFDKQEFDRVMYNDAMKFYHQFH